MHEDDVAESTLNTWKEILKKDGYAVKAGWPKADVPDIALKKASHIFARIDRLNQEATPKEKQRRCI
ncbi:hypothetical protein RHGRI_038186 [Rhododendron griersonianum]|uniref:Uncharacterized protein n=1 Tax=Rhododendron griersonianum TaxID=479676 RepID=A0AAV6I0J2_9ERIC|nr:hypothetical protein RHGRI_038186 [Rhododendron griersonianum]